MELPDTVAERMREVGRIVWSVLLDLYAPNVAYPDEVNGGGCEGFAMDVVESLSEAGYTAAMVWHDEQPTHCYVNVMETGLFYDSEAPYGVENPQALPFFRRANIREG